MITYSRYFFIASAAALLCGCSPQSGPGSGPAKLEHAPDVYKVKFETSKGDFVVQVNKEWAPIGINADPKVSMLWQNMVISDDPVKQSNTRGKITFATRGANTRTTQVFINYADNARLDNSGFSPFGEVLSGMEVVDSFY